MKFKFYYINDGEVEPNIDASNHKEHIFKRTLNKGESVLNELRVLYDNIESEDLWYSQPIGEYWDNKQIYIATHDLVTEYSLLYALHYYLNLDYSINYPEVLV